MVEIGSDIKRNLKDRWASIKDLPKDEIATLKDSFRKLKEIKPVPAVVDAVTGTISNIGDFIDDQALITRRWVEKVLPG